MVVKYMRAPPKEKPKRLRTRLFELNRFYNMGELADILDVSVSYLYRIKEGNRKIGQIFIIAALTAFPKRKFEDLFYIEEVRDNVGKP